MRDYVRSSRYGSGWSARSDKKGIPDTRTFKDTSERGGGWDPCGTAGGATEGGRAIQRPRNQSLDVRGTFQQVPKRCQEAFPLCGMEHRNIRRNGRRLGETMRSCVVHRDGSRRRVRRGGSAAQEDVSAGPKSGSGGGRVVGEPFFVVN